MRQLKFTDKTKAGLKVFILFIGIMVLLQILHILNLFGVYWLELLLNMVLGGTFGWFSSNIAESIARSYNAKI